MLKRIKKYFAKYPESHLWDMNMSLRDLIRKSPKCIKLYEVNEDGTVDDITKMAIVLKYPNSSHYSIEIKLNSTGFYYSADTFINDERCLDLYDTREALDEMTQLRETYIQNIID